MPAPNPYPEEEPYAGPINPPNPARPPSNPIRPYDPGTFHDPNAQGDAPYNDPSGQGQYGTPAGPGNPTGTPNTTEPPVTGGGGRHHPQGQNPIPTTPSGGGGGGGGGGSSSPPAPTAPPDFGLGSTILEGIQNLLSKGAGWDIDLLKQQLLQANKGQTAANEEALYQDAIRRGVFRSGITSGNVARNRRAATASYTQGVAQLLIDKAKADFEAKLQGLNLAQKYVDSARDYLLRSDANAIQKEIGWAQIRLGYARIDLEREQLAKQNHGGGGGLSPEDIFNIINQATGGQPPPPPNYGG